MAAAAAAHRFSPIAKRSPSIEPGPVTRSDRQALHDALDTLHDAEAKREARIDGLVGQLRQAQVAMKDFISAADEAIERSDRLLADEVAPSEPGTWD